MIRQLPITEPDKSRSCGECQACCEVLSVTLDEPGEPELTKRWERCQWQCESGCGIYERAPRPCKAYHCMWRLGWGNEDARPDRLGVVLEGLPTGWVCAVETRIGGAREESASAYLSALREHPTCTAVNVLPFGDEAQFGGYWIGEPPAHITEITEIMRLIQEIHGGAP